MNVLERQLRRAALAAQAWAHARAAMDPPKGPLKCEVYSYMDHETKRWAFRSSGAEDDDLQAPGIHAPSTNPQEDWTHEATVDHTGLVFLHEEKK